ncbi:MAG: cell division protein FtsH [SAR86 cluster bacterium]|uniref:ATP-dependent zinc metalloprotease FtsH n=1 Tax=SAR86 cluster bacterium TaxID=2030880 RepID=A0A2A5CGN3_9GAMM|nr:ATP-dependent zinc metalloprotease FtsH [Gammaproteobacteria bacterium AH-315-E17]PCJ42665.1 MAG: cell division protein FtsH [SAR86 cluster bacterium]
MEKKHQLNFSYFIIAIWMVLLFQLYFGRASQQADISYSQFEQYLENEQISRVAVDERFIRGEFVNPVEGKTSFVTPRMEVDLAEKLADYNVDYSGVVSNDFISNLISWFAPVLVFVFLWFFLFRNFANKQGLGGMMNIGKTKAKVLVEKNTGVTFDDVAGVDEAKAELKEVVQFLKEPEKFNRLGAHIPKGLLLVGPPGTGKTLIARAVAGEADVPFFSISGSEFIEMFVGVGAARVRDLFEQAKSHAPAIIFIDELDALGRARGVGPIAGGHDEREQTLNQLLSEMDGFNPADGVIILAATNRPEILDAALLRAGRFDRQVLVDRPDKIGREQILKVHSKKIKLATGIKLTDVAALTTGFTGADLANLVNEAAIMATRRQGDAVGMNDFVSAIERIVAGLEKRNKLIDPEEKNIVAHHEMGHALVAMTVHPEQVIQKVSVIPRGIGSLGYTIQRPLEDRYLLSKTELGKRMAILLAGRAAETLIFNEITTGASDDLAKASNIAKSMVMQYGMADEIGLLSMDQQRHTFLDQQQYQPHEDYGPEMAGKVTAAMLAFLDKAFAEATTILEKNLSLLKSSAVQLVLDETYDENKMEEIKNKLSTT